MHAFVKLYSVTVVPWKTPLTSSPKLWAARVSPLTGGAVRLGARRLGLGVMAFELTGQIEKHLVDDKIVWLTTVTPGGRPAPRPVWFLWDGTGVVIYSQPDGAKIKHIAVHNEVSLHFNCTPGGGDVVVISGRAELVPGAPLPSQVPAVLDKYLDTINAMGYPREWYDSYSTALRVTPERAWTIPA
jgi:PPOX class probable F420-dependent enzyme